MASSIPMAQLGSPEKTIPLIGLGTATFPFSPSESIKLSVLDAIRAGYRHFDTAAAYRSEEPLGSAVAEALRLGLIQSRANLFITSKLWCTHSHPDLVLPALNQTLQNLGMEYVDLYLIHWPVSLKPREMEFPFPKEDIVPMDFEGVWKAMEECQDSGLAKSIGVSNFTCKKLQDLLSIARIPPAVNQVELNPVWQQKKLREFCKAKGIHVTAYSPLGAKGTPWGSSQVMDNDVLKEIADGKGKTLAQICLRWIHEHGVSAIVKSFNTGRMTENLSIFDWELTLEESEKISRIPQHRGCPGDVFISDEGPYKSIDQLWDGEI